MSERLEACGIDKGRITLRRDWSPSSWVTARRRPRPEDFQGRKLILYSGNGVWLTISIPSWRAIDATIRKARAGPSCGSMQPALERKKSIDGFGRRAFHPSKAGTARELPGVLVAADAHLVTLKPEFMGFVLPSKIYGCIASHRPILFIGPRGSDVHQLCLAEPGLRYQHVDVGESHNVKAVLDDLESGGEFWPLASPG